MSVPVQDALKTIKFLIMFIIMVSVWALFFMVYFDYFIPPLDSLAPLLMPLKGLYEASAGDSMTDRMYLMQGILESSYRVSNISFFTMLVTFIIFSVNLTVVYQQKQRRSRENRLLQLKNREIARRNEFIRYISATITHEFKNNLARIQRRLGLLPGVSGEARERIDGNLDKLFADIKIFKQIADEREEELAGFKEVNLDGLLRAVAMQHSDMADAEFDDHVSLPAIYASDSLLNTVFENLFDNAVKYKKPGQARAQIMVAYSIDRDGRRPYVTISFRDRGTGMDEQQAEKCFYKGMKSETGWGEGLYFAKYVIGLHAGKIRVGKEFTAQDEGTEIIINLPFVEEALYV